ncbi:MAG: hypothetical protein RL026_1970 [Pseudomonadota bacterium]|jgi:hypothetical protein
MNTFHLPAIRRPGAWLRPALFTLMAAALLAPGVSPAQRPRDVPPPPADAAELVRQRSWAFDELHLRPGASLATYRQLRLAPVEVDFARLWARQHPDIKDADAGRLREDLRKLADATFREQFPRGEGGLPVVDGVGPQVLDLRVAIVDLDVFAPEVRDAAQRWAYVLSAAEATLVAELRDSQTGTLLARIVDRRETLRHPDLRLANDITNAADLRQLMGNWVRLLRRQIHAAQAVPDTVPKPSETR